MNQGVSPSCAPVLLVLAVAAQQAKRLAAHCGAADDAARAKALRGAFGTEDAAEAATIAVARGEAKAGNALAAVNEKLAFPKLTLAGVYRELNKLAAATEKAEFEAMLSAGSGRAAVIAAALGKKAHDVDAANTHAMLEARGVGRGVATFGGGDAGRRRWGKAMAAATTAHTFAHEQKKGQDWVTSYKKPDVVRPADRFAYYSLEPEHIALLFLSPLQRAH